MRVLFVLLVFIASADLHADDLRLSAGATYDSASLPNESSTTDSIYRGLGMQLDARLSFDLGKSTGEGPGMAMDLFALHHRSLSNKNISAGLDEPYTRSGMGGGMDLRFGTPFVGIQYMSNTVSINSKRIGVISELKFVSYGFRAGVTFGRATGTSVSLGALYEVGAALPRDSTIITSPQPVNSMSGFLLFHFRVLNANFLEGF